MTDPNDNHGGAANSDAHADWDAATFEGAERAQLREGMRMSLADKLDWLEQAASLAESLRPIGQDRAEGGLKPAAGRPRPENP